MKKQKRGSTWTTFFLWAETHLGIASTNPELNATSQQKRRGTYLPRATTSVICGSTKNVEVDHKIALMNGGNNELDNLALLCDECHKDKTALDWEVQKKRRAIIGGR